MPPGGIAALGVTARLPERLAGDAASGDPRHLPPLKGHACWGLRVVRPSLSPKPGREAPSTGQATLKPNGEPATAPTVLSMSLEGPGWECHCVIHEPPSDRSGWDEGDRKLVADVRRHGWGVLGIDAGDSLPGWAFTAGLWHAFGCPEVAMFGLRFPDMQAWLNDVGEQIRAGNRLRPNELRAGVLPNFSVTCRPVHDSWYRELFGWALWFTQRPPLPIVQVVWPDSEGRFPWDQGCGERCRFDQPQLWLPKDEHPMGRWTRVGQRDPWPFPDDAATRAFTTRRIAGSSR